MKTNKYSIEKYLELHNEVLKFQKGNKSSAEYIINSFSKFIDKYVNFLIYKDRIILKDYSMQLLIARIYKLKDISITKNVSKKQLSIRKQLLINKADELSDSLSLFGEEEIKQTIIETILLMASKYKDTRPSFHNYINKCFYMYLAINIHKYYLKDPINYSIEIDDEINNIVDESLINRVDMSDNFIDTYYLIKNYKKIGNKLSNKVLNYNPYNNKIFDISWMLGYTTNNKIFDLLTILEKELLVLHYIKDKEINEIINIYGSSQSRISRVILKAINKLRGEYNGEKNNV